MYYRQYATFICIFGWTMSVWAAQSQENTLVALPWISIAISSAISLWGGLIATLQKLSATTNSTKSLKIEIAKDLLASAGAGFCAYALGMWGEWNIWLLSVALLIAGYGGSKILDALLNVTIKKIESTQ